jgi:hypothetical protein
LRADAELLPTRALWIHGFDDATGVQLDLLETLALRFESRVWLDRPERIAPARSARGCASGSRRSRCSSRTGARASIRASRHADPEWEARAAAAWARERIAPGSRPSRSRSSRAISRVTGSRCAASSTRSASRSRASAERGGMTPAGRHLSALCELLELGGRDFRRALARRVCACPAAAPADLRDALHQLGIATARDLAATRPSAGAKGVSLAARVGADVDEQG